MLQQAAENPASRTAAVRMRLPSDLQLLALRVGIVAAAVAAAAQPLVLTTRRLDAWNTRTARAIVVDAGALGRSADAATAAEDAVEREAGSAAFQRRFEGRDLRAEIVRAAAWLEATPPARRELVVVSDFVSGAMDESALRVVPSEVGFRAIPVGTTVPTRTLQTERLLGADAIPREAQETVLNGAETAVRRRPVPDGAQGLRLSGAAGDAVLRAVAAAGAPAPHADRPMTIVFSDGEAPRDAEPRALNASSPGWMKHTVLGLQVDDALRAAAWDEPETRFQDAAAWTVVARSGSGAPVVRAAEAGDELLLEVAAPSTSFLGATAVRAALDAGHGGWTRPAEEIVRIPAETMARWNRAPGPVERDAWRQAAESDARWFWALVLVLMGVEQWLRQRGARRSAEAFDAAA